MRAPTSEPRDAFASPPIRVALQSLALIVALMLAGGSAAALSQGAAEPSFFNVSRIEATLLPGDFATRYRVTVQNIPPNERPTYSWYLRLTKAAAGATTALGAGGAGCTNAPLPGGKRLSDTEFEWANQGASFVWYHGARGSYASDPAYGCDQSRIGIAGYPGTVTVVVENQYQHCTATFLGTGSGSRTQQGPPSGCAIGGFTLLPSTVPVPVKLLALYRTLDVQLTTLLGRAQRGDLSAVGALASALRAILQKQRAAFGPLFPPVWGCSFEGLFDDVLRVKRDVGVSSAETAVGKPVLAASLSHESAQMNALASVVRSCEQSSSNMSGAPGAVVAGLVRLAAETAVLQRQARRAKAQAVLGPSLVRVSGSLDSIITRFPRVFGMTFLDLVDRTLAEDAAAGVAGRASAARGASQVVSALQRIRGLEQTIGQALRKQQKHVIAVENSNA